MSISRRMDEEDMDKEWIKQMCTVEYYLAIKNEILPFAARWIALEIIILNKSEKDEYMISLICEI